MKRILALLLATIMLLSLVACGEKPVEDPTDDPAIADQTDPTEKEKVCETADEWAQNVKMGWNLGLSLCVSSKVTPSSFAGMIVMHTTDGLFSRSEYLQFDDTSNSVELNWNLGNDNGVVQSYEGALVGEFGVELWNFSLSESDTLKISVDEFTYTLKSGETISLDDKLGVYETDMSGGTGYASMLTLEASDNLLVSDVVSMHCKMSYVDLTAGEPTPEKIAEQEQAWGNPVTTQEMIDTVRDGGFNLIRIQVAYYNHMDAEGNIDELWLDRVQEVVDYCMNAGVYCLINTTGDRWLTANPDEWEHSKKIYTRLWEQIAERFADYDEKLLFESCNEILYQEGVWWNPPAEAYDIMNDIYQTFVDTVRASGGYNATRNLVLNPYAAAYDYNMNKNFELPKDTVEDHLIAQVHVYVPQQFTFNETNLGSTDFANEWGSEADLAQLDETLKGVKTRFIDELGVPVLIGEFGVATRPAEDERAEYIGYYAQTAEKYGLELCIFDDGGDFAIFDRDLLIWTQPAVLDALFLRNVPEIDPPANEEPPVDEDAAAIDAMTKGWQPLITALSGEMGTFNRSDVHAFPSGSKTVELVWKLGKDNGVVDGAATDVIGNLGIEFSNWDMKNADYLTYKVESLIYVTADGEHVVEGVAGEYKTDMSGGTGYNQLINLAPYGLQIQDVIEIRAVVTFVAHTTE